MAPFMETGKKKQNKQARLRVEQDLYKYQH